MRVSVAAILLVFAPPAFGQSGRQTPPAPRRDVECVQFTSPPRLANGTTFRVRLMRNLELEVRPNDEIHVGPAGDPSHIDYLWLVSPPLQYAPHRFLGPAYDISADDAARMQRSLFFVTNRADYDAVFAAYEHGAPAEEYFALLKRLKLGTLSITITDYAAAQSNVWDWVSFKGQACAPR